MKLGTVLTALAATTLVVAQPALAATRSASSLPAAGTKVASVDGRVGSRVKAGEEIVGVGLLGLVGLVAAFAFLLFVVADEDSGNTDGLPDSP